MQVFEDQLLVRALDAGGDLVAADVRRVELDELAMGNLRRGGLFAYVADEGRPAVFRLTEPGRRRALQVANR